MACELCGLAVCHPSSFRMLQAGAHSTGNPETLPWGGSGCSQLPLWVRPLRAHMAAVLVSKETAENQATWPRAGPVGETRAARGQLPEATPAGRTAQNPGSALPGDETRLLAQGPSATEEELSWTVVQHPPRPPLPQAGPYRSVPRDK